MTRAAYEIAKTYLGLEEWPGARHNPRVVELFAQSGHQWVQDDETPWCAAFVGAVLGQAGMAGTGKLNARSYLDWGEPVDLTDARQGDIVVFWRGSRDGWQGHVGFYEGQRHDTIMVLGGNQGNKVSVAEYPEARLLGVRRARQPRAAVTETKTARASTAQITAGAASVGTAIAALDGQAQQIAIIGGLILVAFGLWFFRNRLKDFARGAR